jgi:hypothetical protein
VIGEIGRVRFAEFHAPQFILSSFPGETFFNTLLAQKPDAEQKPQLKIVAREDAYPAQRLPGAGQISLVEEYAA